MVLDYTDLKPHKRTDQDPWTMAFVGHVWQHGAKGNRQKETASSKKGVVVHVKR